MIHSLAMTAKRSGSIRLSEDERAALLEMADKLGACIDGRPSLARLMSEVAAGSVALVRVRSYQPASRAARIREAIEARPDATNREIAEALSMPLLYVTQTRSRMRQESKGAGDP